MMVKTHSKENIPQRIKKNDQMLVPLSWIRSQPLFLLFQVLGCRRRILLLHTHWVVLTIEISEAIQVWKQLTSFSKALSSTYCSEHRSLCKIVLIIIWSDSVSKNSFYCNHMKTHSSFNYNEQNCEEFLMVLIIKTLL